MGWWSEFERAEVAADFARIAASGLDSVRVFLIWEDFQPARNRVDPVMLERLVTVADLAGELGLVLVPTLFTGHMSGVNWIPGWALGGSGRAKLPTRAISSRCTATRSTPAGPTGRPTSSCSRFWAM